jgi:hypothetical protein
MTLTCFRETSSSTSLKRVLGNYDFLEHACGMADILTAQSGGGITLYQVAA